MDWLRAQKQLQGDLVVGATLLALMLAGCARAGSSLPDVATTTPATTTTTQPTAAASATTQSAINTTACSATSGMPLSRVGDLGISQVVKTLDYTDWAIPQGTPNKSLQLLSADPGNPPPGSVAVGSHGTTNGFFTFSVCNLSTSQTDTLQSFSVRVASFVPYSGSLSAWNPCNDGSYDTQTHLASSGGCGGGFRSDVFLQATFPGDARVGDSVTFRESLTSPTGPYDPALLPLSLAPGQGVWMAASLTAPTAPGTYTFAFGIAVGVAAPAYFSTSSPTLFAPITLNWSGQNCTTSAMQAQIPAATQPTYYICPPAA